MPRTGLCRHTHDQIFYRDKSLVDDLMGTAPFSAVMFRQILNRDPSIGEQKMIDAILVTLMEHGMTPSAISARLIYMSAPESLQAGVAAGLLGVGSTFIGTMEGCGQLLARIVDHGDQAREMQRIIHEHKLARKALPGFGHHLHKPDDPRATRLLNLAQEHDTASRHVHALRRLSLEVDRSHGKHITINATGAIAAILADIGVPVAAMRGFAVVARAAGLVAHLVEEGRNPTGRFIWDLVDHSIPFEADTPVA
jgi:citrate synthase